MPRDMFDDVVRPSVKVGSRGWYTLPLSIAAHIVLAVVVIAVPLMAADVLPKPPTIHEVFTAAPPPPPPPPPVAPVAPTQVQRAPVDPAIAPTVAPIAIVAEPPAPYVPNAGPGVEGGLPEGLVGSTGLTSGRAVVPLPPPAPPPTEPVRVGGRIAIPKKLKDVRPVYPEIARAARVSGIVIIEATIGVDGFVKNARVLKSIALLDQAALDAVRQWQFSPTRLNGVPIPVIMTVTLDFKLQ